MLPVTSSWSTRTRNFRPFTCYITLTVLTGQIKAQTGDLVEFWYGNDNQIAMKDGNVTQVIALEEVSE